MKPVSCSLYHGESPDELASGARLGTQGTGLEMVPQNS